MRQTVQRWIGAKVDEMLYDRINELSATLGYHPHAMLPEIIRRGIMAIADELEQKPVGIRLWLAQQRIAEREKQIAMLQNIAYIAFTSNDEQLVDEFEKFCRELDIDAADMLNDVASGNRGRVELSATGTSVDSCTAWLRAYMSEDTEYYATAIRRDAQQIGFTDYALSRAKSALGVRSVKRGTMWVWIRPGGSNKVTVDEMLERIAQ